MKNTRPTNKQGSDNQTISASNKVVQFPNSKFKPTYRDKPTKEEQLYMDKVTDLGCIVCRLLLNEITPKSNTIFHHIREGVGKGQRSPHKRGLPLCPPHHLGFGYGISFHDGKEIWQKKFGTELELKAIVDELLIEEEAKTSIFLT